MPHYPSSLGTSLHTGWERRSETTFLGLPLLHAVAGRDPFTGKRRTACGVVAVGQFATGVVAICQVGAGVVALSQFAVASLFGMGQFMLAPAAVAQFALTVLGAIGQFAIGFAAVGQFAIGPTGNLYGAVSLPLGDGLLGAILTCLPAVIGWVGAASILRRLGHGTPRAIYARGLPRGRALSTAELRSGPVVVRGRVAPGQGTLFDVADLTQSSEPSPKLRTTEFLLQDDAGAVRVRTSGAMLYIAARGSEIRLAEGDVVEVEGTAITIPDPSAASNDYRHAPAQWVVEARTVAGHQSIYTVGAMARFPGLLAVPMIASAVVSTAISIFLGILQTPGVPRLG